MEEERRETKNASKQNKFNQMKCQANFHMAAHMQSQTTRNIINSLVSPHCVAL